MKRFLLSMLVVCGCILICSCGNEQDASLEKDNVNSYKQMDKNNMEASLQDEWDVAGSLSEESSGISDVGTGNDISSGSQTVDERFLIIKNLYEYEQYISKTNLADGFVDYNMINQLGEFDAFTVPSVVSVEYAGEYWYDLVDKDGECYSLHVYHNFEEPEQPYKVIQNASQTINDSDLRTAATKEAGVYDKDGIKYFYSPNGSLLRIRWDVGNTVLFLGGANLSKMRLDTENAIGIGKLLKAETAKNALIEMFGEEFSK